MLTRRLDIPFNGPQLMAFTMRRELLEAFARRMTAMTSPIWRNSVAPLGRKERLILWQIM